jgi:hypothetical protein
VNGQCDGCQAEPGLPVPGARIETCPACEEIRKARTIAWCHGAPGPDYPRPTPGLAGFDAARREYYAGLRRSGQVLTPREAPGG